MRPLTPEEQLVIDRMVGDRDFRIALIRKSLFWFFHFYFQNYVKHQTGDFQRQIFQVLSDQDKQNIVITAFRGSGKSTIVTLAYVIWSILGEQDKKFPLILGHTQPKAQNHLLAIKHEFENNALLRADLGPFKEENNQWGATALILPQYGAKIAIGSTEQSVRGIRHYEHRPDVIICDDIEDMNSVRTQENRDKLFEWLTSDVLPAGDKDTRMIFVGTPLHEDSLLKRLEKLFERDGSKNAFRRYPIVDVLGRPIWPGKFPTIADVEAEKAKCFSDRAWQREYLLKIVPPDDQIIKRESIRYYKDLPSTSFRQVALMIDPARSLNATADYTAMVAGRMYGVGKDRVIYILPNPVNARLNTEQLIGKVKLLSQTLATNASPLRVYVEDVAFQGIIADLLKGAGINAKPYPIKGQTKEGRLEAVGALIEVGKVLFPEHGAEPLIEQMLGFGSEKHDDLVDACTMLVFQLLENTKNYPSVMWVSGGNSPPRPGTNDWMTTMRGWRTVSRM